MEVTDVVGDFLSTLDPPPVGGFPRRTEAHRWHFNEDDWHPWLFKFPSK